MVTHLLIAAGAGAASALLFVLAASGAGIALLLSLLAALPIMIVALAWGHWTGLAAALIAAGGLALVIDPVFFVTFLVAIGLPAWWLGYLALLARPAATQGGELEWYPVGRLVAWAGALGALVIVFVVLKFGIDAESYRSTLHKLFEQVLRAQMRTPAGAPLQVPGVTDVERFIDLIVTIVPPAAAAMAAVTNNVNLWLAGRIVKVSGRLRRPWPDIAAMRFPRFAPALLALGFASTALAGGMAGVIGSVLAAAMAMAYAVLGFAVLHAITRGAANRGLVLGGAYAAVLVVGWPIIAVIALGLADSAFDLRSRVARNRAPPANPI